jgi:hypothetical protein
MLTPQNTINVIILIFFYLKEEDFYKSHCTLFLKTELKEAINKS